MSLINEALKKAQLLRAAEAVPEPATAEPPETSPAVVARKAPRSARAVALITLGAGLFVLGGSLLAYFLFALPATTVVLGPVRPPSKPAPVAVQPIPPAANENDLPSAEAIPAAPKAAQSSAAATAPPAPAGAAFATTAADSASSHPPQRSGSSVTPATSAAGPAVAPPATGPIADAATPRPSELVQAFIDRVRVMGIRAAGDDSRVLLDGRHYRLNDLVERNLGVRLVKVEANCVTFEDPTGATYVKYF